MLQRRCGKRRSASLPRTRGVGYRKREATKRFTPATGDPEAPTAKLVSALCCSLEQPYNEQQNHRADNGNDESADEATGEMKAQ